MPKSKLELEETSIYVVINHFLNLLKPVNIKNTKNWKHILSVSKHKNNLDEETLKMLLAGEVFKNDLFNKEKRSKMKKTFEKPKIKVKRNRIVKVKIKIDVEEYI